MRSSTCSLTVHLQTDCDVHGASDIHSGADIIPSVLGDSFLNVQTAVTPQKDPSIGLHLGRKKHYWQPKDYLCAGLHLAGSSDHPYRSSV